MSWFRFHTEALNDPKVQKLPAELFRTWVNVLCMTRNRGGEPFSDLDEVSFILRMPLAKVQLQMQHLIDAELLDRVENGLIPHNWHLWQYESDVSTNRVREFRKRKTKRDETVSETPSEQSRTEDRTEAESETKRSRVSSLAPAGKDYAFRGKFVESVTEGDLAEWLKAFPSLPRAEMLADLARCDAYYTRGFKGKPPKNWFITASNWLERTHKRSLEDASKGGVTKSGRKLDAVQAAALKGVL